ncbi:MAG TPA: hypothetical protein VMU76_11870 [Acidimicrobiales bacterium]|nr:hypothetical protein [Acidimicrobiales bacterium]
MPSRLLNFPVFDADNQMYEATGAFTRYLPPEYGVVFGSDYPHPEGMADPITFIDELEGLSEADQALVMGGNMAKLMKIA